MSVAVWMAVAERLEWMSDFDALSCVCPSIQRNERLWMQQHGLVSDNNDLYMYKDGERHGLHQWSHASGSLAYRCLYENGKLKGLAEQWSPGGKLRARYMHKNGVLDGLFRRWVGNCTFHSGGLYKDGKRHGVHEYVDYNDCLVSRVPRLISAATK
jgi:hypothetical protein